MDPKAALTTAPAQTGGGHGRSALNTNKACCIHFCVTLMHRPSGAEHSWLRIRVTSFYLGYRHLPHIAAAAAGRVTPPAAAEIGALGR